MVAVQSGIASRKNRADLDVEHQDVEEGQDASEDQPGPVVVVEDVVGGEPQVGGHPVHKVPCFEEHVHLGQPELEEFGHVDEEGDGDGGEDEGGKVAEVGVVVAVADSSSVEDILLDTLHITLDQMEDVLINKNQEVETNFLYPHHWQHADG